MSTTAGRGNTTVTIRITERNLGNSSRSATLTVSTEGGPSARIQTINVVQNILTPVLSVDRLSLSLNGANTKDSFKIQSNIDWKITSTSTWLIVSDSVGTDNATILVTSKESNISGIARSTTLIVSPVGVPSVASITLTIDQKPTSITTQWSKLYGGSLEDYVNSALKTNDGGIIMIGSTKSFDGDVNSTLEMSDAWLVKLDANGAKQWSKNFGGSNHDEGFAVGNTTDGGHILAASTNSIDGDAIGNHGESDVLVVKINSNGEKIWSRVFGGTRSETAKSIVCTADGGYLLGGMTNSSDGDIANSNGNYDGWLIKLDANGNKQWSRTYGGTTKEQIWSVIIDKDGGYVFTGGRAKSADLDMDAWVVKTDLYGVQQWSKTYGGTDTDISWSICSLSNGEYIFSGFSGSKNGDINDPHGWDDAWVVKIDYLGNKVWSKNYGGSSYDVGYAFSNLNDGTFLMAIATESIDGDIPGNTGDMDTWIVKLNSDGSKDWIKSYSGPGRDACQALVLTDDGFFMAGSTESNSGIMQGSHGLWDGFVIKVKIQ